MESAIESRLPEVAIPSHYVLGLSVDLESKAYSGKVSIDLSIIKETKIIAVNSKGVKVSRANIKYATNGDSAICAASISENADKEKTDIEFAQPIKVGNALLELEFNAELRDDLTGFYYSSYEYKANGTQKPIASTQFEPHYARRCFPCFDEPNLKATFDVSIEAQQNLTVLSNMAEKRRSSVETQNRVLVEFNTTPRMSTYLLAFVVGDFEFVEAFDSDGVKIRVYTALGKAKEGEFALGIAAKTLPYYKEYFGVPYPLDKLDMISLPNFAAGAMENWGLVTFREVLLLLNESNSSLMGKQTIALVTCHELAHMWFGNLVTMKWWNDLWLNEGFATWIMYLCTDMCCPEFDIWTYFVSVIMVTANNYDSLKSSHSIQVEVKSPDEIDSIFDSISYNKSGCVLRMLNDFLTKEVFKSGLQLYMQRHKYANTSTSDLWSALEHVSNKPIARIMSSWTEQMGFPLVFVRPICDAHGNTVQIALRQKRFLLDAASRTTQDEFVWLIPVTVCALDNSSNILGHFLMQPNHEEQIFTLPAPHSGHIRINPESCGFYYTKYSDELMSHVKTACAAGQIGDKDRLRLVSESFAMAISGDASLCEALDLCEVFNQERNYKVWVALLSEIDKVRNLLDQRGVSLDKLHKWRASLAAHAFDKLGMQPNEKGEGEGESVNDAMLRPLLIGVMSAAGEPEVLRRGLAMWEQHFQAAISKSAAEQKNLISADSRVSIYTLAIKHGGEQRVQEMLQMYETVDQSEEKLRIYQGLSRVAPPLLPKMLEFLTSSKVLFQDYPRNFRYLASSAAGQRLIWEYTKENWKGGWIEKMSSFLLRHVLEASAMNFATEHDLQDVTQFYEKNPSKLALSEKQIIENIKINVGVWQRNEKALKERFA